jgi:Bacterial HORMA domain family 1
MTSSRTATSSFTITEARYVGAKVGADLRMINSLHGRPPLADIDNYVEEVALLLRDGYLGTVDYGFMNGVTRDWKLRLRYTATVGGQLLDSRPGGLPTTGNFAAYSFYSYLTYSAKFNGLSSTQQAGIKQQLPITRVGAEEPSTGSGSTSSGHGYGRNGSGVNRDIYTAY